MSSFLLLIILFLSLGTSDCFTSHHRQQEQQSLLAFKFSLTSDPNHSLSSWTVDIPFCNWTGVICNLQQHVVVSLNLSAMGLQGSISSHLANLSFLQTIDLSDNALHGSIPPQLSSLYELKYLSLRGNRLGGGIPSSLGSLSKLIHLDLGQNILSGQIPSQIGYLTSLTLLDFSVNHLNGTIPPLKRLQNLERLFLHKNEFVGTIPNEFGQLRHFHLLKISYNKLSGRIPQCIGNLQGFKRLFLNHNHLSDMIPVSLGYCKKLQLLDLSHNSLIGSIPQEVANLSHIRFYLNLSFNYLEDSVPQEIGNLVRAQAIDISHNMLNGVIPETLGNCTALQYLNLSRNVLEGSVPYSFGNLQNLRYMDLSSNYLTGTIPMSFKKLKFLLFLNLSFNCLAVDEHKGRSFTNGTPVISLIGNGGLLGSNVFSLPACIRHNSHMVLVTIPLRKIIGAVAGGAFVVTALIFLLGFVWIRKWEKKILNEHSLQSLSDKKILDRIKLPQISYEDIVKATDGFDETNFLGKGNSGATDGFVEANILGEGNPYQDIMRETDIFSHANLLGKGNSGSVYKGLMSDGKNVAVKVFNLKKKDARKNFTAECEVFSRLRHRNLVKIKSFCSTYNFKALIFEFMCNESLEKHLYPDNYPSCELGPKERLNIAIDLAHAIKYLHHDCYVQIVHCDIKPSNVLLDQDITAHLSDFGMSTVHFDCHFSDYDTDNSKDLKGTVGYIAPEYELSGRISTKSDVYSYGILLLEMVMGKSPTHDMFEGDLTLHKWVNLAFQNQVLDVIDRRLLTDATGNEIQIVVSLLRIGLWCSKNTAEARPTMRHVSYLLEIIKEEWVTGTSSSAKLKRSLSDLLSGTETGRLYSTSYPPGVYWRSNFGYVADHQTSSAKLEGSIPLD